MRRLCNRHNTDNMTIDSAPVLWELRSLEYWYPNGRKALDGIDLIVCPGDRIALLGPNGAGKTTLVKHLNGLFRPGSGEVLYKGRLLEGAHLAAARMETGMLFQDPDDQLFCNTLDEDVSFGPLNQNLTGKEVADRVGLALARTGMDHLRYKAPHHLSYGQKKRAAFATVLAMNPQTLILDEPTTNLDPKQERHFSHLISECSGTLICISHDLAFLQHVCSRAVVLEEGKIIHDRPLQDLFGNGDFLGRHGFERSFPMNRLPVNRKETPPCKAGEPSAPPGSGALWNAHKAPDGTDRGETLIEMRNYSYRYSDGTWGIRDVSLLVAEGESVAVMGENGAGKSTLISCLAGATEGEGEYVFDRRPVRGRHRRNLWRQLGIVFQDPADQLVFPSVREEMAFGLKQMGFGSTQIAERVCETLAMVGLDGFEERAPHHLSSGERKRVALASVLAMRPRVLVLDEPTSNLDPKNEGLLCEILQRLPVTKILASHDIDIISHLCERTIVLHEGRILRDYPTSRLLVDDSLAADGGPDYTFKSEPAGRMMDLQRIPERD